MSPKVCFVLMSPVPLTTVIAPSATVHLAALPFRSVQLSRFRPSKSTIASDGAAPGVLPGVTTLGSGSHTSVSFGLGLFWLYAVVVMRTRAEMMQYFISDGIVVN